MSYAVSNLGINMYYDWDRPIRQANYNNMLSYQKSLDRGKFNGFQSCYGDYKPDVMEIAEKLDKMDGMGSVNKYGTNSTPYLLKTNAGINNIEPISRALNANKYSVITNNVIDHNDRLHQVYLGWASRLQTNEGMADPIQDTSNNYPAKKYMSY